VARRRLARRRGQPHHRELRTHVRPGLLHLHTRRRPAPTASRTDSAEAGADTALVLRSFCRYNDFGAELACNDDVSPQNYLSDVSVDLAAGETVYVLVGGVQNAAFQKGSFRGRYRLIATRR
jgi:hypothetical protein